jgi:hypothetical protein
MNLTSYQLLIVGVVALVLTSLISWLVETGLPKLMTLLKVKVTIDLGRFVKTIIVGAVAFLLAWWWYPATLPKFLGWDFPSFSAWFSLLLTALSPYIGSAMAIYNLLLGYILDPVKRANCILWLYNNFLPVPPAPTSSETTYTALVSTTPPTPPAP